MSDLEKLRDALWSCVILVCLLFFAFAAGVACMEREEAEPEADSSVEAVETAAVMPVPAADEPQERQLGLCEDTYLREDIPLSYELQAMLYGACLEFEVPYELALAVVEQETNFRNVTGDDGASEGYMQVQQRFHKDRMDELGVTDLMDPESNFRVACHYLRDLFDRYGDTHKVLMAYNAGPSGAAKLWSEGIMTSSYSRSVMERMQKYGQ